MAGILSKGIKLSYASSGSSSTYTDLTNLQEIPELGNGTPDKVDVTVLSDGAKMSIEGLFDASQDLSFKFLYEDTQFGTLSAMTGEKNWKVTLPAASGSTAKTATFTGSPSVRLDGVGVNAALTYTLNISLTSTITFA